MKLGVLQPLVVVLFAVLLVSTYTSTAVVIVTRIVKMLCVYRRFMPIAEGRYH